MIENLSVSFQGIWSHKLRSLLTMLGIIIGIASIISIVSNIKGTNDQIKENLIGAGNNIVARDHINTAVRMDPDNFLYRQLKAQLENGQAQYRSMGRSFGNPMDAFGGDMCTRLCLANLLCNCCCGGRVFMC